MGRKKKNNKPITGVNRVPENKLTVLKSRPLFALWRSGLTLSELKILDTYLSRIDSKKPENRVVLFDKGELEKLLGVKKINNVELQSRLTHLMGNVVKVDDPTKNKSYRLVALFEEAVADQDENGLWQVRLECTQKAMKYFFNIEQLGYLRYKLRAITALGSRYSYILFMYLEANRFRTPWEVNLDELKAILCCDQEETYKAFKRFNDRLLKRCQKELHEKTPCKFTYEPIKKGRSVVALRFILEPLSEPKPIDPNQLTLAEYEENHLEDDTISFLQGAVIPSGSKVPEFDRKQMAQILELLCVIDTDKMPSVVPTGDIEFRRYHYLSYQYAVLNRKDTRNKPIVNRYAYFIKMLKSEAGIA